MISSAHVMLAVFAATLMASAAELRAADGGNYADTVARLEAVVKDELARNIIPGVSIALVDDQRTVFVGGFGLADKQRRTPAGPDTVYRAGSISKLFTAIAAMQLVEQGKLDLDAPITTYLPEFRIVVPFEGAKPITLRQLMCHRSGMIRESPVGSYFDETAPGMARTIASVADCVLVYPPDTRTQYSNVGPTIVGMVVGKVAGMPFERFQREKVLGPIGMKDSAWLFGDVQRAKAASGYMRVADGKGGFGESVAPQFDLGTLAAGNLYTSAADLARFASVLLAQGTAGDARILRADSLRQMFTPQLTKEPKAFGIGFAIGEFRGHKTAHHMGAVYGFTSSLVVMPQEKVAVVVLANEDIAIGPVVRLANTALALMLEAKLGEKVAAPGKLDIAPGQLEGFAGQFESQSYWAELSVKDGTLHANVSGQPMVLTPREPDKFEAAGRYVHESFFTFDKGDGGRVTGFTALGQKFVRVDPARAPVSPAEWDKLLGSYGPAFIPLVVSVRHGHLYAMTENMFDYRLHPVNRHTFRMPPGLYNDEHLVFQVRPDGTCDSVVLANVRMARPGGRGNANAARPSARSLISADNTWTLWAIILVGTAAAIYLEQNYKWAAKISGPVLALLIAMGLSNLRVMPCASPVYDAVGDYFVPLAIPLLLFRANLVEIVRSTGSLFAAVQVAIVGTLIGTFVAAFAFQGRMEQVPEAGGIMAASYIGGGVNFFAVKQIFNIHENLTGPLLVADNVVMAGAFLLLFWFADRPFFRRHFRHPHSAAVDAEAAALSAQHWQRKPIALIDVAAALAVAITIAALAQVIAAQVKRYLASQEDKSGVMLAAIARSLVGSPFVWLTLLSVVVATLFPRALGQIHGADEIGAYLLYLFLFVIGLPADLWLVLGSVPQMFAFCAIIAVVNIGVLLAVGYVFGMKLEDLLLSSNATLGGPPTAAAMAISKGWHRLVLPGLLIGLWGYIVGTFLGIVVVETLRRILR